MAQTVKVDVETKKMIKDSILGYLHNVDEAYYGPLSSEREFSTHGSFINEKFLRCLLGKEVLPEGTMVYAFPHRRIFYSAYKWIGDEQYPADGATMYTTGSDYTFVVVIEKNGEKILAHDYVSTEPYEKKAIGTV